MPKVSRKHRQPSLHVIAVAIPLQKGGLGEPVAKMPNSAFSPECRVPENAERCRLGLDLASLPIVRSALFDPLFSRLLSGEVEELCTSAFFKFPKTIRRLHARCTVRRWSCSS